jgi:hypothetical protein
MIFFHLLGEMDLGEDLVPEVMLNDTDALALREILDLTNTQRTLEGPELLTVLERCEFLVENPFYVEGKIKGWNPVLRDIIHTSLKDMHELLYFAKVAGCGIAWS